MNKVQFKNLLAFLFIMSNGSEIFSKSPDYIIEKANRYLDVKNIRDEEEFYWGLHPALKKAYDAYCEQWEWQINNLK